MGTVFKKTLKISLCCILAALMVSSSIAAGSALDGAEENELEVITPTEAETQGETVAETQEETQTETQNETQTATETETQTDVSVEGRYILGDVNSDSSVNLLDAIAIQKFSLSMVDFADIQKQCGDVDRNEAVNLLDSIMIQKFALGMLSEDSKIGKYFTPSTPTEPTQPTDPPTQPTDPPTQPTDPPTTPSEPPTQPTDPTEPDTVELNKTALTLGVGEKYTLIKSSPTGSDLSDAVFTTNKPDIVKVDAATGEVAGLKVGGATVRITTRNGATASCSVAVKKAPTSISLNKTSLTLGIGETFDLNSSLPSGEAAYHIAYSSNNSSVSGVKASGGLVTANKVGTANITATTYNGKTVTCTVIVKKAPTSMSLNKTSLTLRIGEYFDLNSSLPSGQGAYSILYSSSKPSVASVKAAGGLVCAVQEGTATITARTYNDVTAICTVTVEKVPKKIQSFVDKALSYKGQDYSHFIAAMSMYGAQKGDAWCAWFVSTISKESGLSGIIPISGGAGSIPRLGVARGAGIWYEGYNSVPRVGDIIVFTWNCLGYYPGQDIYFSDHVGIVYKVDNEYVYTIEGNATDVSPTEEKLKVSGLSDSNLTRKVCCRQYKLYSKLINGYYRPNY